MDNDFLATELMGELKAQCRRQFVLIATLVTVLVVIVGGFLWYLNQYDFSSTTTTTKVAKYFSE